MVYFVSYDMHSFCDRLWIPRPLNSKYNVGYISNMELFCSTKEIVISNIRITI